MCVCVCVCVCLSTDGEAGPGLKAAPDCVSRARPMLRVCVCVRLCLCLLMGCVCVCVCVCVHPSLVISDTSKPHRLYPTRLLCPGNFPSKNTGSGCHFLLQGIFWIQGLNPISYISCTGKRTFYHGTIWEASMYVHNSYMCI